LKPSIKADRHAAGPLPSELVTIVVKELISWVSQARLRNICKKLDLTEPPEADAPREEYGKILKQALAGSNSADLLLSQILKEFVKSRPPKKNTHAWDSWQGKHYSIVRALRKHGLDPDGFPVGPPVIPPDLEAALVVLGSKVSVREKLRLAGHHLRERKCFDPKTTGAWLRSAIEVVHSELVSELQTAQERFSSQRDADRRAHLCKIGFISKSEEKVSNSIYGLLSAEFIHEEEHDRSARKDTAVFVQSTVHSYLILLLGRLREERDGKIRKDGRRAGD